MPAAIDTTNGVSLFASFRQPAWHGLGTVFDHEVTDYMEMLSIAGLAGWDVRFEELEVVGHADARFVVPAQAVIRTNPTDSGTDVLGVVGQRYEILQNEQAFEFLQSLQDGARWETAGAIKDGRVAFGSIALDRTFVLDPSGAGDEVGCYLLVHTSHDGSTGLAGGRTGVRVVCQNTLDMAIRGLSSKFNIRHTQNAEKRMAEVAELWRTTNVYFDEFEAEAQTLYAQAVTDKQFFGIVEDLFPKPEKDVKGSLKKWESRQELFSQAWKGEPNAPIRYTGWGALNALTEANQWGRKVRSGNDENFFAAGAGFDGPTRDFRQVALTRVKALASV